MYAIVCRMGNRTGRRNRTAILDCYWLANTKPVNAELPMCTVFSRHACNRFVSRAISPLGIGQGAGNCYPAIVLMMRWPLYRHVAQVVNAVCGCNDSPVEVPVYSRLSTPEEDLLSLPVFSRLSAQTRLVRVSLARIYPIMQAERRTTTFL